MAPRTFALVFGVVYVLVALVEILFSQGSNCTTGFLCFAAVHNAVHWVTGVLGLLAYWQGEAMSRLYAQVFGVVFLLVAVLGFIPATAEGFLKGLLGYQVNAFYNVVHLVTGLLGVWAGFGGASEVKKA